MKLRICSDLHVEFMRDGGQSICAELVADRDFDVLVVAGDLCSLRGLRAALQMVAAAAAGRRVVHVLGNHEAYGGTRAEALAAARAAAASCANLTVLEQEVAVLAGRRFVGCTLWFPHAGTPGPLDGYLGDRGRRDARGLQPLRLRPVEPRRAEPALRRRLHGGAAWLRRLSARPGRCRRACRGCAASG